MLKNVNIVTKVMIGSIGVEMIISPHRALKERKSIMKNLLNYTDEHFIYEEKLQEQAGTN